VNKFAKLCGFALAIVLFSAVSAFAQGAGTTTQVPLISFSGAFGAAFVTIGAAYGISKLAAAALESMARQPEVAGNIQTAMIIAAALIEGFTFFALFITMQAVNRGM